MAAENYNIGDKVMLREGSRWAIPGEHSANPIHCYGTITSKDGSYCISWSNGTTNSCYEDHDLYPYGEAKDTPKQSSSDILAEAIRKFPIGTSYKPLTDKGNPYSDGRVKKSIRTPNWVSPAGIDCGYGYIYAEGKWAEIVYQELSTDADTILEEAKRRFPVGSKYIPISPSGKPYDDVYTVDHEPHFLSDSKDRMDCGIGYCYINGKWAKSVSHSSETPAKKKPYVPTEAEVLARYPKGTWYLPLNQDGSIGTEPKVSKGIYEKGDNFIWVNSSTSTGYIYNIDQQRWADVVTEPKSDSDDKDGILQEAKRRFPIGTKYTPLDCHGFEWSHYTVSTREATWYNDNGIDVGDGLCYVNGRWAEVDSSEPSKPVTIEKSEEEHKAELLAKFPPGTIFKSVYGDGSHSDDDYEVKADWILTRGLSCDTYWFIRPSGVSPHTAYIRNDRGGDALIVRQEAVSSAENTDLRSARVKLLPEIEVRRQIVI